MVYRYLRDSIKLAFIQQQFSGMAYGWMAAEPQQLRSHSKD